MRSLGMLLRMSDGDTGHHIVGGGKQLCLGKRVVLDDADSELEAGKVVLRGSRDGPNI